MGCVFSKEPGGRIILLSVQAPAVVPLPSSATACATSPALPTHPAEAAVTAAADGGKVAAPAMVKAGLAPIQLCDPCTFHTEELRMSVLRATRMVDTDPERRFDTITALMGGIFQTPVALITLLVDDRVWFKSKWGPIGSCVARDGSWCNWALVPTHPEVLVCEDATLDARFACSPYVIGPPHIRFYAGAPLIGKGGMRYGTLCVIDVKPRSFSAELYSLLSNFAMLAVQELERDLELMSDLAPAANTPPDTLQAVLLLDVCTMPWSVLYANDAFAERTGQELASCTEAGFWQQYELVPLEAATSVMHAIKHSIPVEVRVCCKATGQELCIVLCPASSDQIWPNKPIGVPNWVPSELAPGQRDLPSGRVQLLTPAAGGSQGQCGAATADDSAAGPSLQPQPCIMYWFAVLWREAEDSPRPLAALPAISRATRSSDSPLLMPGTPIHGTDCWQEAQRCSKPSERPSLRPPGMYGCHSIPSELDGLLIGPLIGKGSYGRVYRGVWRGKAVAVKVVECLLGSREGHDALNEALLTESLDHPHLVKTFTHAVQTHPPGQECAVWLIQQLCTCGTLIEAAEMGLLRCKRTLGALSDMVCVLRTLREVADCLAFLHGRGILHRDLTCHNVLLDRAQPCGSDRRGFTCRVGDFGMGRLVHGSRISTATYGTVTHMSPELLIDGLLTPAADVWSFGVLCWEAYSGIRAFAGLPMPTVVYRVTSGRDPLELPHDAPTGFKALVVSCLDRDHELRPDSASVLCTLDKLVAQQDEEEQRRMSAAACAAC